MSGEIAALLLIVLFFLALLSIRFIMFVRAFGKDLRTVNEEINRASPSERPRWLRARRRLWLSLIPFYTPKRRKHR